MKNNISRLVKSLVGIVLIVFGILGHKSFGMVLNKQAEKLFGEDSGLSRWLNDAGLSWGIANFTGRTTGIVLIIVGGLLLYLVIKSRVVKKEPTTRQP